MAEPTDDSQRLEGAPVKPRVFISYSSQDEGAARELSQLCKKVGVEAWLDRDSLQAGSDWSNSVDEAVRKSDIFFVLISAASLNSEYARREWSSICEQGWKNPNVRIVPIRLESVSLPPFLQSRVSMDALNTRDLHRCVRQIHDRSADVGKEPARNIDSPPTRTTDRFRELQNILTHSHELGDEPGLDK